MAIGTDTGGKDQGMIGTFYAQEMELWRKWGYTPPEIVQAATRIGAEAAGYGETLGTLEPGKLADLIIVPGDPLKDLSLLLRPTLVMKDGVILRQQAVDASN